MEYRNFSSNDGNHMQQLTFNRSRIGDNVATHNREIAEPAPAHGTGEDGGSYMKAGNAESHLTRTTAGQKWGSSFWKDCQPATSCGALESGEEAKSGSEYKGSEVEAEESDGAEAMMEYEGDGVTHKGMARKAHHAVPVDDMLSDEYYEQDDGDQSDSMNHRKAVSHSSRFSSKPPPRSTAPSSNFRKPKGLKVNQYNEEDGDYEDYDDDEFEDDPNDTDFDPDYGATTSGHGHRETEDKDDDWDAEESNDDNIDEDDLEVSDEDKPYFRRSRAKQSAKGGHNVKPTRGLKLLAQSSRRKTGRVIEEDEDESSDQESENNIFDDFKSTRRRAAPVRQKNGRSDSVNASRRNSETRTSGRSMRKVSYIESDGSEDVDEGQKKNQKEEIVEEDGDAIEKVLWHQPKGSAEEALRNNRSTEPVLLSYLFDSQLDWNEMEFLIKWKGQSHLHCQWKSFSELQNLSGFKKVLNYTKRVMEDVKYRKAVSREESDARALRVVLSLTGVKEGLKGHVVVEMSDLDNEPLVKLVGGELIETVVAHDVIGGLMIQCALQPGLAQIWEDILGFENAEFYIKRWPELDGRPFRDVLISFPDAIPCGVKIAADGGRLR